jgi:hypothetical protein
MSLTDIEPDSPCGRVALHLKGAGATGMVDRTLAATLLGVAPAAVDKVLQPGVEAGLFTVRNDGDMGRVWCAGRLFEEWQPGLGKIKPPVKSAAAAAAPKKPPTVRDLPDPAKVKIRTDVPLPPKTTGVGAQSAYDQILDRMSPGNSVELPSKQAYSLSTRAKKRGIAVALRKLNPQTTGVWRLAKAEA